MLYTFADLILDAANQQAAIQGPIPRPIPHPPIRQRRSPQLTCDQRRDCQLLYSLGWLQSQIHNKFP